MSVNKAAGVNLFDDAPADAAVREFAESVARGLSDRPRRLDCRYIYDTEGSRIFEAICRQPEYYLTRCEAAVLEAAADDIAAATGRICLIEFGSGSSAKTRILLDAYTRRYGSVCYMPVDISKSALDAAKTEINDNHPAVEVNEFHGPYDQAFGLFAKMSPAMFLFLGSNLGNLDAGESERFWTDVGGHLRPGDFCLLGIDINRHVDSLNLAYNDAAGYSAAFTRNIFERMNRELGAGIDTRFIDHVARYHPDRQQVEIFARLQRPQRIDIGPLEQSFVLQSGDAVLTEISRKFRLEQIVPYLRTFGLRTQKIYKDKTGRFAVLLLRR